MEAATRRRGAAPLLPGSGSLSGFAAAVLRAPYACAPLHAPAAAAPTTARPDGAGHCSRLLAAAAFEDKAPGTGAVVMEALKRAGGGGAAGAAAMAANVAGLMWLRTTVCFQYRYGMSTGAAMKHLYNDGGRGLGGVLRFYRGFGPALLQAPLARFGDTAANAGTLALLDDVSATQNLPVWLKTGAASVAAGGFRILLMPIDACKTLMQVEGKDGLSVLRTKMKAHGPRVLYAGALGAASATLVGHYPWCVRIDLHFSWHSLVPNHGEAPVSHLSGIADAVPVSFCRFLVYNSLNARLPQYDRHSELGLYLARNATIGFCASALSDTVSNSIRVLKTTKQASPAAISYRQAAASVIAADGVQGLFLRGLKTKILANGLQGMCFTILWRMGQDALAKKEEDKQR